MRVCSGLSAFMVIDWVYLCIGLVFGLIPPLRLLNCECKFLPFEEMWNRAVRPPSDADAPRRRRWWKLPLVWINPFRGFVVGYFLSKAFGAPPEATFLQAQLPVLALLGALLLVLVVQTKGRPFERESLAPNGFMAGLMLAVMPLTISLGAFVVGVATAMALQRYSFGYWAATIMTALIGAAFLRASPKLGVYVLMVSAPAWMSWLRGTTLVTPVRC